MGDKTLYDRLGGAFAIAGVIDAFSDALIEDPMVGQRSPIRRLREMAHAAARPLAGLECSCDAVGYTTSPEARSSTAEPGRAPRPSGSRTGARAWRGTHAGRV